MPTVPGVSGGREASLASDCQLGSDTSSFWAAGEVPCHDPITSCLLYSHLYAGESVLCTFLNVMNGAFVRKKISWTFKREPIGLLAGPLGQEGKGPAAAGAERGCGVD